MATKLGLYNGALFLVGERSLSSLSEAREPRRLLDAVYDDTVLLALEAGFWKFALRTTKLDYSASVTPEFGYEYGFQKPTDLLRLHKVCQDELLQTPLIDFSEERGFWFAHDTQIYVSYVSKDTQYGKDLSQWPPSFTEYVKHLLATKIADRLTPPEDVGKQGNNNLERRMRTALSDALGKDAVQGPPSFYPQGNWTIDRTNSVRNGGRRDRGKRGSLIG